MNTYGNNKGLNKIKSMIRKAFINTKIKQCAKHTNYETGYIMIKAPVKKFDSIKDIESKKAVKILYN